MNQSLTDDSFTRMETEFLEPGRAAELSHQTQVGPYQIESVLGRGGVGIVYKAKVVESCSVPVGRTVGLKMLHERHIDNTERHRFIREAGYLQALRHPGIVRILDFGEHHDRPYLVMQFIEGHNLDGLLRDHARKTHQPYLDDTTVCDVMVQGLEALHTAHLAGILHRDLKPGNFMVTESGTVKLLDFGMAQRLDNDSRLTASGSVLGTPAYMSPEQASGLRDELSARSDIYSMGAVAYELVTGRQPFPAENSIAVLRRILEEDITPPSRLRADMNRDLETVILKAMAKDPRDRYYTAEQMADDLRRLSQGMRVRARRLGNIKPLARRLWRRRRLIATAGLLLFVLAAVSVAATRKVLAVIESQQAQLKDQKEDQKDLATRLQAKWQAKWRHDGPLVWEEIARPVRHKVKLSEQQVRLVSLPRIADNVRLSLTATPQAEDCLLEMLICDGDIGQGYSLRLMGTDGDIELSLLRWRPGKRDQRAVISTFPLDKEPPLRLTIAKEQEVIRVTLNDDQPVQPFPDLAPLEGPDSDGVHIAVKGETVRIEDVLLERQRQPELISRLATADILRQYGRYNRALQLYRQFLDDFPAHEQARTARYRIGLCLRALGEDSREHLEEAFRVFQEVARDSEGDPLYYKNALCMAWTCAVDLGRFDEAERYFETIRQRYALPHLLASVPLATLRGLLDNYLDRAQADRLPIDDPHRSSELFITAGELAAYLGETERMTTAFTTAGDLLVTVGELDQARTSYRRVVEADALARDDRLDARLRIAHLERLRFQDLGYERDVLASYSELMVDQDGTSSVAARARLWLGEVYVQLGDIERAVQTWRGAHDHRSLAGRLMRHLADARNPFPYDRRRKDSSNDIDYFNGILLMMLGRMDEAREHLERAAADYPAYDWPTILARLRLEEMTGASMLPHPRM